MSAGADGRRAHGGRLSLRTLAVASVSSATAAVVTSHVWRPGTPVAAAVTPIIVALVSELLERPLARLEPRVRRRGAAARTASGPGIRVYRAAAERLRRRILLAALATGIAGFVVGGALLTASELVAGRSLADRGRRTTIFGGAGSEEREPARTTTAPTKTVGGANSAPAPQGTTPDDNEAQTPRTTPTTPPAEQPPAGGPTAPTHTAPQATPQSPPSDGSAGQ
ncbi:hypothetical protein JDY09_02790 [Thermoleophilum album]|jgi:hypothetical protein|uniref:hypothetical protein n=1 Tax=Thermoleophilum album TaxID=29539 RepID=UPI00237D017B|nr:hypothetical protein [Thermoleophilum album]WDT94197.1 hypothetical protein JDY09_02790 [Thermoleophilum album]